MRMYVDGAQYTQIRAYEKYSTVMPGMCMQNYAGMRLYLFSIAVDSTVMLIYIYIDVTYLIY